VFEILLTDAAKRDLRNTVDWWSEHRSIIEAERWYASILSSIYSLEHNPKRCVLARESTRLKIELHNLWFGMANKQTHRVLFIVDGDCVNILRVLGTRQDTTDLNLTE